MKTNFIRAAIALILSIISLFLLPFRVTAQGSLTPPGAPAPTMKTLHQIEPRTPIGSLPFTISNPGSFYLAADLTGAAGTTGITITTNDVTLDLNGFTLTGASSSNGVDIVGNRLNVVVRNGAIRNWWICLQAAASSSCRFEGLLLSGGANLDLQAGDDSLVESCRANGSSVGIRVNNGCTIRNCQVSTNGTGILAIAGSTIVDCTAIANQRGIEADEGSTIKGCTVTAGGGNFGIITSSGCTVTGCTVEGNQSDGISLDRGTVKDCTVRNVIGNGIDLFLYCHAIGNTCIENTGAGIRCTQSGDSVVGNMVTANGRGIWCNPATGNLIIQNRANGNSTNYDIGPSNTAGPIVNSANIATSTNPHANYSY